ncbi:hypothetical protein [Pararhizobium antarcticum]|uniref:Uncharacterized protein n=1 Tax=Pararhizobium antarcticum TaxID=1798805 RepID=A0A657LLE5_9HYPH|nr:hypothetical protein [Pararhizobium antarcticum]OJF91292.1 hypothetical protein AX760_07165 [Pararhizobium antarcticum]OJG01199.1 hypothetical protein AX761_00870 [Rhizobium sp. 58]
MVTPLQSVRLQSAQFLLKALKETEQETQAQASNTRTALLQRYGVEPSSSGSSNTLAGLLSGLSPSTTQTPATEVTISTDVTTASFMAGLKQSLQERTETAGTGAQGKSMLAALEAGTLAVTDPLNGVTITAWDPTTADAKDTAGNTGKTTETSGWSAFLKTHLARADNAAFVKTADGSYVDTITGNSAYFGTVGSVYVYLTWPQAQTTA